MKTITKSARLSMKTKTNTLLGAVLFLLVIGAAAPGANAQSDTFDGTVINRLQWEVSAPLGASTVTQNDALFLTSDGTPGTFCNTPGLFGPGAGISLRRKLSGDFDIQVDFTNFSGPSVDFVQAFFNVYQDQDNQLHIKRIRGSSTDGIQTVAKVGGGGLINGATSFNPVTSGTFRITRSGSVITAFFNEAPDFSIPGFSGDVIISLVLFGPEGESANVVYDNFTINSGTLVDPLLVCPECVPLPPGAAQVQPPINADGTSIFNGRRGVVPVKFRLTCDGNPTCNLPPATIALTRTAGGILGEVNESVYSSQADSGSNFRTLECQYHYNLYSGALGVGTYRVDILIGGQVVGSATFQLK